MKTATLNNFSTIINKLITMSEIERSLFLKYLIILNPLGMKNPLSISRLLTMMVLSVLLQVQIFAQSNPTPQAVPYTQDFSGLPHSSSAYPAGWQGWQLNSAIGSSYNISAPSANKSLTASGTATNTSNGVYNYDGKVGFLSSGSGTGNNAIVLAIDGTNYETIQVTYDVMTIRDPYDGSSNTRINEVTLQVRTDVSGDFVTLTGQEYSSNQTPQTSGTAGVNIQTKTYTLPPSCNRQGIIQLRWLNRDVSGGGSRPSFAIDNISISGTYTPVHNITQNTYHGTIQAAVTAATAGDVIEVSAGTYTETISLSTAVTLRGPNYNILGFDPRGPEAILENTTINANATSGSASIEGFKFYTTNDPSQTIFLSDRNINITIKNNIFERQGINAGKFVRAINMNSGMGLRKIEGNLFTGDPVDVGSTSTVKSWRSAIWTSALTHGLNLQITNNNFNNINTAFNMDDGIAGVTVENNVFGANMGTMIGIGGANPVSGSYTWGQNSFSSGVGTLFNCNNCASTFRLDVSSSTIDGLSTDDIPLSSFFDWELNKMIHLGKGGTPSPGLILLKENSIFVRETAIQNAVNYSVNGDTVFVYQDTYNEAVNVNKVITLIGSGSDASGSIITKSGGTALTLGAGTSNTDRVVAKNFRLTGSVTGLVTNDYNTIDNIVSILNSSYGLNINSGNDLIVSNSKFNNHEEGSGLKLADAKSGSNWVFTNCEFNNNKYGWYSGSNSGTEPTLDNVSVTNSTFNNNKVIGIYLNKLSNAVFDGITVDGSGYDDSYGLRMSGVDLHLKYRTDYENITFMNSIFSNNGTAGDNSAGFMIRARDDGSYASNPAAVNNVHLQNNFFNNNAGVGTYSAGIIVGHTENGTSGNNATTTNVVIENNSITGNSPYSLLNATTGTVSATCNWHGSTDNSTILATFVNAGSGNILLNSILTNGTDSDIAIGFQPTSGACVLPVVITDVDSTDQTCATLGSIIVTFEEGTSPYNIAWTGGSELGVSSPYTISGLSAGTYGITVTDANGFFSTDMVTVNYLPVTNTTQSTYHATIQAAIDAATTQDNDVIEVCAGYIS